MHTAFETTRSASRRRQPAAGGFSLLEMMIAIAVLGIGLVMVAAIFPVALDLHRRSADETLALQHAYQARAIIRAKIAPTLTDPTNTLLPHNTKGQFFVVPFQSLPQGFPLGEDPNKPINPKLTPVDFLNDINYAASLNGGLNPTIALRVWSDLCGPPKQFADVAEVPREDLKERPRYVWYAFYRYNNPSGDLSDVTWFVAVCRVTGGTYVPDPAAPAGTRDSQLPLPWRIGLNTSSRGPQLLAASSPNPLEMPLPPRDPPWPATPLVVRGSRLFSQQTGQLYTVVRTLRVDSTNRLVPEGLAPTFLELREQVSKDERASGAYWIFPPPTGESESPYVAGLVF
ncbi:MAG TPA: prepilin-type N-terminal cleavage/methylation domain-containing protein [Phycisphaerae bacterium]|nr:prepilin-type N-terminal cleavage/methylation domain-containing protein [Phycisphaerae bacterium]